MNPRLRSLQPYPFTKLRALLSGVSPAADKTPISWALGEPMHRPPPLALAALQDEQAAGWDRYPAIAGMPELREAITAWLERRFDLPSGTLDPDQQIAPVAGTREALFSFTQAVVDGTQPGASVMLPNPGYQIYEGAALLAGAVPHYLPIDSASGFLPDLDAPSAAEWGRCQLFFLCSPGNPTGAVAPAAYQRRLLELAERYDFIVAADECYSELYPDEADPPAGLLQVAAASGDTEFTRVAVFHSLSKRSNLPGLRSGFVAGGHSMIQAYALYRTYHGAGLPVPVQRASIAAWRDETHVVENRAEYRRKFKAVLEELSPVLAIEPPAGSFYLWPEIPGDDQDFARELYRSQHLKVLPGSFLGRSVGGTNPGAGRVRIALVAPVDACIEGAARLRAFLNTG
ncbi:MAG: succinyldiaminopimelate transaminase [Pseudomonadota bacterium]|nr:succinyldiaminopimelate transaminase [Pseudomonadota bacterium]